MREHKILFEPSTTSRCENCDATIASSSRICAHCHEGRESFSTNFTRCECGELTVGSESGCWNCDAPTTETVTPDAPYFCRRCGDFAVGMGWRLCKFCWDYVALKDALQKGIPVSEIPIYSDMWDSTKLVRTPECQGCGHPNDPWRSFCISCGCYLVDKNKFINN